MTVPPEIETTAPPATEITVPTVTETAARPATEMETVPTATETAARRGTEMEDPLATGTADRSAETIIPEMIIPTASIRQPLLLR